MALVKLTSYLIDLIFNFHKAADKVTMNNGEYG